MHAGSEERERSGSPGGRRGLSTARAVLQVETLLAGRPRGVRAAEVAQVLGKSVSTAYNLLASLCEEGIAVRDTGAVYRLAPGFRHLVAAGEPPPDLDPRFSELVGALLARTHKRSYLSLVEDGRLRVVLERGSRGMPRLNGLRPVIRDSAHALALGKVALALSTREAVDDYVRDGLRGFTASTITRGDALRRELREIRRTGIAHDREEFDEDFCCLAAPILDEHRRFVGALGVSMTRRAYEDEHEALQESLREVAREAGAAVWPEPFQACADPRLVLEPPPEPALASSRGRTA